MTFNVTRFLSGDVGRVDLHVPVLLKADQTTPVATEFLDTLMGQGPNITHAFK